MSSQSSDGQYPGQRPGQYPDPSASQPPAQAYPQPGYAPSTPLSDQPPAQVDAQLPFQPVGTAYGYGGPGQQGPQPPKKNTGLIVGVVSAVVVALVASGVGAFLLLRGDNDDAAPKANTTTTAPATSTHPDAEGQEIIAPTAGIALSVPSDWTVIDNPTAVSAQTLKTMATHSGQDENAFRQQLTNYDVYAGSTESSPVGGKQIADSVNVLRKTHTRLPAEEEMPEQLASVGAVMTSYEKVTTANGEGAAVYYDATMSNRPRYGAILVVPNASGDYPVITFQTTDTATAEELVAMAAASASTR